MGRASVVDDGGTGADGTGPRESSAGPQFLPPDQLLDGSPRPAEVPDKPDQEAPPPQPEEPVEARTPMWRRRSWLAGIAGVGILVAGGATSLALRDDSSSPRFVSLPGPCTVVQRATVERLAPKAGSAEPYTPD